jgi:hypothetical protein
MKGQSLIEYLMLLSVIMILGFSIFNSDKFKKMTGADSEVFNSYKRHIEYTYMHGLSGSSNGANIKPDYIKIHDTYWNNEKNTTHFFTPVQEQN